MAEGRLDSHYWIFHSFICGFRTFNVFLVEKKRCLRDKICESWVSKNLDAFFTTFSEDILCRIWLLLCKLVFLTIFCVFSCLKFKLCTFCSVALKPIERERGLWILFCSRIFHRKDDIHNRVNLPPLSKRLTPWGRGPIFPCDIQTWYKIPLIVFFKKRIVIYEFSFGHPLLLKPNSFFSRGMRTRSGSTAARDLSQANGVCCKPSPGNSNQWGHCKPAMRGGVPPAAAACLLRLIATTVQFPRPKM